MELIKIITILCIAIYFLQSSYANANQVFLPRKLKVITAKELGDRDSASYYKADGATVSGPYHNEPPSTVHVTSGKTWVDETDDTSEELFTMDYSRVRKRRPIHNKSLPLAP